MELEFVKKESNGALTFFGILMILFGLVYAILGTLSLMGTITGLLPGHEKQEIIIVVLSYVIAIISFIGGIASVKRKYGTAKVIGLVFTIVWLASLIYVQLTQETFNTFDCIAMLLGVSIFYLSSTAKQKKQ